MFFGVIAVIAAWFLGALAIPWLQRDPYKDGRRYADKVIGDHAYPVNIHAPIAVGLVDTGEIDIHGKPVMVGCATCHDTREPNFTTIDGTALKDFHVGLQYKHGDQTCLSCHNSEDYGSLKRADGQALDFSSSMQLCAQCHGPQFRDYQNGSHGGMTGYWDLKQGPRERNHCTDCHDPHHPAFPQVMPVFPPKPVIGEAVKPAHGKNSH
jgi:formate-dependent nitrite reductase cytochrome c552 subunit